METERFTAEVRPVKVTKTATGRYVFRGVASTIGNADRQKRCFLPGAFGTDKQRTSLLLNHDDTKTVGQSWLTPVGLELLHESSLNPKVPESAVAQSQIEDGDIASTSISWLSDQRYYGWSDLKRQKPALAKQAAAIGCDQGEDIVYFGSAEIVENSLVPVPANPRALISAASLIGETDRGYIESMLEVASLAATTPVRRETAAGSRHNASDRANIQMAHDALSNLGATCTVMPEGTTDVEDGDDSQEHMDMTQHIPLGGWSKDMAPGQHAAFVVAEAETAAEATEDTNQPPVQLPAELAELDRELAVLQSRFTA